MHEHATHSRFHLDFLRFADSIDFFFDETLPWPKERFRELPTDSLRVITHEKHCLA